MFLGFFGTFLDFDRWDSWWFLPEISNMDGGGGRRWMVGGLEGQRWDGDSVVTWPTAAIDHLLLLLLLVLLELISSFFSRVLFLFQTVLSDRFCYLPDSTQLQKIIKIIYFLFFLRKNSRKNRRSQRWNQQRMQMRGRRRCLACVAPNWPNVSHVIGHQVAPPLPTH